MFAFLESIFNIGARMILLKIRPLPISTKNQLMATCFSYEEYKLHENRNFGLVGSSHIVDAQ